jgi:hypothetical protein
MGASKPLQQAMQATATVADARAVLAGLTGLAAAA